MRIRKSFAAITSIKNRVAQPVPTLRSTIWTAAAAGICAGALFSGSASAQVLNDDLGRIGANLSEFDPVPIRVGTFELFPRIDAELEYNDNILATDLAVVDDVVLSFVPAVIARDRRPDREILIGLQAGADFYLGNTFNNQFRGEANGAVRLGLGTGTRPFFGVEISRNNSRGQPDDDVRLVAQPITVSRLETNAGIERDFNRFTGIVEATARLVSYDGAFNIDGRAFDVGFRDNRIYEGRAQLSYSRSDNQRVFVEAIFNDQSFNGVSNDPNLPINLRQDRSSSGFRLQAGYARQLTNLLRLRLRAGYLRQDFDSPAFGTVSGVSFDGDIAWRPTPLTIVNAGLRRSIDQRTNPLFSGGLRTEAWFAVEHELLRNMTLTGRGRYGWVDDISTVDTVTEYNIAAGARYRLDRHWSLAVNVERFERNELFPFEQNRAILSARYNF